MSTVTVEGRSEDAVKGDHSVIRRHLQRRANVVWEDDNNGQIANSPWLVELGYSKKQDRHTVRLIHREDYPTPIDRCFSITSSKRATVIYDTVIVAMSIQFAQALIDNTPEQ